MQVVVLISGRGSNLAALLNNQENYTVNHVISNNDTAKGLSIAKQHGIPNTYLNWSDRMVAENSLIEVIQSSQADLIILAGFMRILSAKVVNSFHNKIINIHPSLLPKYPGLNTHQKVINNGDLLHGASIHLVDDKLDHGRILTQTQLEVHSKHNASSLAQQLISKEHKLLTTTVGLISAAQLTWDDNQLYFQKQPLTTPLNID